MTNIAGAPVIAGLTVGIMVVVLFSAMASQVPYVKTTVDFSNEASIDILPVINRSDLAKPIPSLDVNPYAVANVNKSKEIVISNSGWGMWLRHTSTLMTIDNVTVFYADNAFHEMFPDLFERKNTDFFAVIMNYTMKNLDDQEYYALVHVFAIDQDGKRYQEDVYPGEMTAPLYPNESRSSWFGLQIPQDSDEVTLEIRDSQTGRRLWTLQLDMQPFGQKPSLQQKFMQLPDDFALVYSYGYGYDIKFDTKKGMIMVKTCDEPPLQNVTVTLSKEQLGRIWQTALQNDFFRLPDFTEDCPSPVGPCVLVNPESSAKLRITGYNQTHIVDSRQGYEMNFGGFNSDFAKYKQIRSMLEDIIAKVELPKSKCAYL